VYSDLELIFASLITIPDFVYLYGTGFSILFMIDLHFFCQSECIRTLSLECV